MAETIEVDGVEVEVSVVEHGSSTTAEARVVPQSPAAALADELRKITDVDVFEGVEDAEYAACCSEAGLVSDILAAVDTRQREGMSVDEGDEKGEINITRLEPRASWDSGAEGIYVGWEDVDDTEPMSVDEAKEYLSEQADHRFGAVINTDKPDRDLYVPDSSGVGPDHFDVPDGWRAYTVDDGYRGVGFEKVA